MQLRAGLREHHLLAVLVRDALLILLVGVAVDDDVDAGGVRDHGARAPRCCDACLSQVRERHHVVGPGGARVVDGLLHAVVERLPCLILAEAVDQVAVGILEVGGVRRGERLGRGDAHVGHLRGAVGFHHIGGELGFAGRKVVEVARRVRRVRTVYQEAQPVHAVVELVVAGHGHVEAYLVHDVHQVRPFGERADGLALHGVARVHERHVARAVGRLGLLLDGRDACVADAGRVAFLVEGLVHAAVHIVGVEDGEGPLGGFHGVGLQRGVVEPEVVAGALAAHVVEGEVVPGIDAGELVGVVALAGFALRVRDFVRAVVAFGGYLVRAVCKLNGGHDRERVTRLHLERRIAQLEGEIPRVVQGLGRAPHELAARGIEPLGLVDGGRGVLVHGQLDGATGLVHEGAHRTYRFKTACFEHVGEPHGRVAVPPSVAHARAVVLVDAVVGVVGAPCRVRRVLGLVGREIAQGGVVVGQVEVAPVAPVVRPAVLDDPCAVARRRLLVLVVAEGEGDGRWELLLLEGIVPADDGHLVVRHLRGCFVLIVFICAVIRALLAVPVVG